MKRALALLLLVGCATAAPMGEPPRGTVVCTADQHYGYIRTDALMSTEGNAILAHEQHHLMQARMFGGCEAWTVFLRDKGNRARAEAAAFCISAVVIAEERLVPNMAAAVEHYATQLSAAYPSLELTLDEARALIWSFCR